MRLDGRPSCSFVYVASRSMANASVSDSSTSSSLLYSTFRSALTLKSRKNERMKGGKVYKMIIAPSEQS